jgi:hypothetical protein
MGKPYIDAAWFIQRQYFETRPVDWWEGTGLENHMKEVLSASTLFSVRWVFVQKDGPRTFRFGSASDTSILNTGKKAAMAMRYLDSHEWARKVLENNYYAVYEIPREHTLPHLYAAQAIIANKLSTPGNIYK